MYCLYIITQKGRTALIEATLYGHKDIVQALIDYKADPNITDEVNVGYS